MNIRVCYQAQAKQAAGVAEEVVEMAEGGTALALLQHLAAAHGGPLRALLLTPEGAMRPSLLLFVGDQQVRAPESRELANGDTVLILPPMSGG